MKNYYYNLNIPNIDFVKKWRIDNNWIPAVCDIAFKYRKELSKNGFKWFKEYHNNDKSYFDNDLLSFITNIHNDKSSEHYKIYEINIGGYKDIFIIISDKQI